MKKCPHCGSFCQDADVVCGICGAHIANIPALKGRVEDEILKDQKEAERRGTLLKQTLTRSSKRRLVRKLLASISSIAIGSAILVYAMVYVVSGGQVYTGTFVSFLDIFALVGGFTLTILGFTLIILGFNLGMKGGTKGGGGVYSSAYGGVGISNLSMRATYEGQFLSKERQDESKRSG